MCKLLNQSYVLEAFPTFDDAEFSIYHSSVFYKKVYANIILEQETYI